MTGQVVDFYLNCPENGFVANEVATVRCTVQGNAVTSAGCISPVRDVYLELFGPSITSTTQAWSSFPACQSDWTHAGNYNGRCVSQDAGNVYTYEFNITTDPASLNNETGIRCTASCVIFGKPNPFSSNSSSTCGPPAIYFSTYSPVSTLSISNSFVDCPKLK